MNARQLTHFACTTHATIHPYADYRAHMDADHDGRSDCVLGLELDAILFHATNVASIDTWKAEVTERTDRELTRIASERAALRSQLAALDDTESDLLSAEAAVPPCAAPRPIPARPGQPA